MFRDLFDPEDQRIVLVDAATLREAERLIQSCERCHPEGANILFEAILNHITDSDPRVTDHILETAARCPNCREDVLEKTLVEPA